ncbi:MAG: DUF4202 domain-containing protein [Acidobacteria bacterium]|nr:DUF4202 domain-containing protein [Acidobacteriota bacterium]
MEHREELYQAGDRFQRAINAIDARNQGDPNRLLVGGVERPKEQAHAEMVFDWVRRLRPDASEALLLAARAHHVRRWVIPRSQFPEGRVGYLNWRNALKEVHAAELREAMSTAGYGDPEIARAGFIVRKRDLTRDPDSATLEDAVCLVFVETQLHEVAAKLDRAKMIDVLRKTMRKMTPQGLAHAMRLDVPPADRQLLAEAAEGL